MSLQKFLEDNKPFFELRDNGKVLCSLTNQEFGKEGDEEKTLQILNKYVSGKNFIMKRDCYSMEFNSYENEGIVSHKMHAKKLFCYICKTELNKIPKQIENHISGKKHQRLKLQPKNEEENFDNEDSNEQQEEILQQFWHEDSVPEQEEPKPDRPKNKYIRPPTVIEDKKNSSIFQLQEPPVGEVDETEFEVVPAEENFDKPKVSFEEEDEEDFEMVKTTIATVSKKRRKRQKKTKPNKKNKIN